LTEGRESLERVLEEAISRTLRENLAPLERTATDLQRSVVDLVTSCSMGNPKNALPAMLRTQAFASSLSASLSVLSNFVAIAMNSPDLGSVAKASTLQAAPPVAEPIEKSIEQPIAYRAERPSVAPHVVPQMHELPVEPEPLVHSVQAYESELQPAPEPPTAPDHEPAVTEPEVPGHAAAPEAAPTDPAFDVSAFPTDIQDLHRRANRVAKVAMQDIKLLHPNDVQLGREHKDICGRLRSDLDKARKEYDRRFRAIQDHPVDYFHRWMVDILAEGKVEALGDYPYPSPVLRH
jgi:hypothetical protein